MALMGLPLLLFAFLSLLRERLGDGLELDAQASVLNFVQFYLLLQGQGRLALLFEEALRLGVLFGPLLSLRTLFGDGQSE